MARNGHRFRIGFCCCLIGIFIFAAAAGCSPSIKESDSSDLSSSSPPFSSLSSSSRNDFSSRDSSTSSGVESAVSSSLGVSSAPAKTSSKTVSLPRTSSTSSGNDSKPENKKFVQKEFYISTFRAVHFGGEEEKYRRIIKATKEVGINLIENAILSREDCLLSAKICEEQGINFFISNITNDKGFTGMGDRVPEVNEELVKFVVNEVKHYKYLLGYYIWDEVTPNKFATCRTIKEYFNKYDPTRLAFSLVFPSYGEYKWGSSIEDSPYYNYVSDYIKEVNPDVLSMDYYALKSANSSIIKSDLWRDMGLFRLKSIETGKPFWWYFQGYDMADGTVGHMTRAKLAVQMYSGIAYGAKTVSYFQSLGALTTEFGEKTSLYDDAKALHVEVKNVGNLMFDKKSLYIYHFGLNDKLNKLYFLDDISQSKYIMGAPNNTIVSIFGDSGNAKYIMVVNKDHSNPVRGNLSFKSEFDVDGYDKKNNTFKRIFDNALSVFMEIGPGDCMVYKIS